MIRIAVIALSIAASLAIGFVGGAYNSFDYWKGECGVAITRSFIELGFLKPGQTGPIDLDQSHRIDKFTVVP